MQFITAPNGVCYIRSDHIAFPHGFSTRIGGVSSLTHTASLNLAFGRGDDEAVVMANPGALYRSGWRAGRSAFPAADSFGRGADCAPGRPGAGLSAPGGRELRRVRHGGTWRNAGR